MKLAAKPVASRMSSMFGVAAAIYDYSGVSGLDFADDSRAFAVTDLDGDGNVDLF